MLEAHREIILKSFDAIGIKVKRLAKAPLGDGWYVYHDYAPVSAIPHYRYTVIEQDDYHTKKLREKIMTKSEFISDCDEADFTASLAMSIAEAQHRAA